MKKKTILILGSNLGDRKKYLADAIHSLSDRVGEIVGISSVYESESWGYIDSAYLNQVVVVATVLSPENLLSECLAIENFYGRTRGEDRYQARTLDIDILFYGDEVINQPDLIIPHPRIAERLFVLMPLIEVAPEKIHPIEKVSIKKLLSNCADTSNVIRKEE